MRKCKLRKRHQALVIDDIFTFFLDYTEVDPNFLMLGLLLFKLR